MVLDPRPHVGFRPLGLDCAVVVTALRALLGEGRSACSGAGEEGRKVAEVLARDVGRIAILSEREWIKWTALVSQLFIDAQIKIFEEEAAAREWLAAE